MSRLRSPPSLLRNEAGAAEDDGRGGEVDDGDRKNNEGDTDGTVPKRVRFRNFPRLQKIPSCREPRSFFGSIRFAS